MAKRKPRKLNRDFMIYAGLAILIILLASIVAVLIEQQSEDKLTAWASSKATELETFFQDCRNTGGFMEVLPSENTEIIFSCVYEDRTVEYSILPPGKTR